MTTYTAAKYRETGARNPVAGINIKLVNHTTSAAYAKATSDVLKVMKLPKGVVVDPANCALGAYTDPDDADSATVSLKYTDGTTTKTIIATGNLQAADTALTGTDSTLIANSFHVTDSDDYYVYMTVEANALDSGVVLGFKIAYISDPGLV